MVRTWILLAFIGSIATCLLVVMYNIREYLKEKYYKFRFPEKVIAVIIHYPGTNLYKKFWRLIPDVKELYMENGLYFYDDSKLVKQNDLFASRSGDDFKITVEGKIYDLKDHYLIKGKSKHYPEIHYKYNNPVPMDFQTEDNTIYKDTAKDYKNIIENNIMAKLLSLTQEQSMIILLMVLVFINMAISGVLLAKTMGWIK